MKKLVQTNTSRYPLLNIALGIVSFFLSILSVIFVITMLAVALGS
jgi:hypothetical protein